jgi:hypothetical protein
VDGLRQTKASKPQFHPPPVEAVEIVAGRPVAEYDTMLRQLDEARLAGGYDAVELQRITALVHGLRAQARETAGDLAGAAAGFRIAAERRLDLLKRGGPFDDAEFGTDLAGAFQAQLRIVQTSHGNGSRFAGLLGRSQPPPSLRAAAATLRLLAEASPLLVRRLPSGAPVEDAPWYKTVAKQLEQVDMAPRFIRAELRKTRDAIARSLGVE